MCWLCTAAGLLLAVVCSSPLAAAEPATAKAEPDLTKLSIEELMKVNVLDQTITSVGKTPQRLGEAPAAVTVIVQDDIKRSGLNSLPELLRLVPGLQVAQLNANEWAITARGFNDYYANKLLVLQDGRTLYNRAFSGVSWGMQDTILEDLDRIEVIRGPGATLWGSNAVNGVINITTKDARDTQGVLVDTRVGTQQQTESVRYGGKLDDSTYYRVYGKYRLTADQTFAQQTRGDAQPVVEGDDAHDGYHDGLGGFRIDRHVDDQTQFTLQGEVAAGQYDNTETRVRAIEPLEPRHDIQSNTERAYALGRWTHGDGDGSHYMVQAYYDHSFVDDPTIGYQEDVLDLEFQHSLPLGKQNELMWGLQYRLIVEQTEGSERMYFDPADKSSQMLSLFVQDCWIITPDRLRAYVGSKFEVNSYSGFEWEPSAKLLWTPDDKQSFWCSVSRAVRTPSRAEEDLEWNIFAAHTAGPPVIGHFSGNPSMRSEELLAWELGYRIKPAKSFSLDVTGFVNRYDHLATSPFGTPAVEGPPLHLTIPLTRENDLSGQTYGLEISADWRVLDCWRIAASYTWLTADLAVLGTDREDEIQWEENIPHNQAQLHSYLDITRNVSFNTSLYYVDLINYSRIPPYLRLDMNVSWRPTKNIELILGASNLLDPSHAEWNASPQKELSTESQQEFYGQFILKF